MIPPDQQIPVATQLGISPEDLQGYDLQLIEFVQFHAPVLSAGLKAIFTHLDFSQLILGEKHGNL